MGLGEVAELPLPVRPGLVVLAQERMHGIAELPERILERGGASKDREYCTPPTKSTFFDPCRRSRSISGCIPAFMSASPWAGMADRRLVEDLEHDAPVLGERGDDLAPGAPGGGRRQAGRVGQPEAPCHCMETMTLKPAARVRAIPAGTWSR